MALRKVKNLKEVFEQLIEETECSSTEQVTSKPNEKVVINNGVSGILGNFEKFKEKQLSYEKVEKTISVKFIENHVKNKIDNFEECRSVGLLASNERKTSAPNLGTLETIKSQLEENRLEDTNKGGKEKKVIHKLNVTNIEETFKVEECEKKEKEVKKLDINLKKKIEEKFKVPNKVEKKEIEVKKLDIKGIFKKASDELADETHEDDNSDDGGLSEGAGEAVLHLLSVALATGKLLLISSGPAVEWQGMVLGEYSHHHGRAANAVYQQATLRIHGVGLVVLTMGSGDGFSKFVYFKNLRQTIKYLVGLFSCLQAVVQAGGSHWLYTVGDTVCVGGCVGSDQSNLRVAGPRLYGDGWEFWTGDTWQPDPHLKLFKWNQLDCLPTVCKAEDFIISILNFRLYFIQHK